jgi:hypothetical protein
MNLLELKNLIDKAVYWIWILGGGRRELNRRLVAQTIDFIEWRMELEPRLNH